MNYKIQLYHFHEYARRELKLNVAWNNIIKCRRDEDLVDAKKIVNSTRMEQAVHFRIANVDIIAKGSKEIRVEPLNKRRK